jgi:hypothetical protein
VATDPQSRKSLVYPTPAHKSFFLHATRDPKPTTKAAFCEEIIDALTELPESPWRR